METAKIIPFPAQGEAAALALEGFHLKSQLEEMQARLREIDFRLAELAQFEPGKKSTTLDARDGVRAKITLKEYEKWDQEKLAVARHAIGDERFFSVFKWEFSPRSKKDLDGFMRFADESQRAIVLDALTVKPGKPAVSYERTEA